MTAERRVIWSHVLHAGTSLLSNLMLHHTEVVSDLATRPAGTDREWALVLGRPMQINQYSTLMPTEADLMAWPWDYRQYMLARNELTP